MWTKELEIQRAVNLAVNRTGDPPLCFWGTPIFLNTFRHGVDDWEAHPDYPATSVSRVSTTYWYAGYSLQITDGSAAPSAGTVTMARRISHPIPKGKVAIQVHWKYESETNTENVIFRVDLINGPYRKLCGLRYIPSTQTWQRIDETGAWVDITTQNLPAGIWHRLIMKLDFWDPDIDYVRYVAVESDWKMLISAEYTSAQDEGYAEETTDDPRLSIEIGSTNAIAAASTIYIDNAVCVQGEIWTIRDMEKIRMSMAQLTP